MTDIEKFDSNSTMLSVLFTLVTKLVIQSTLPELTVKLIDELQLLQMLCKRIGLSEYAVKPNERKDIYAYINKFVMHLYQLSTEETKPETEVIKKLLPK